MFAVRNVKVSRVLLDVWVANRRLGDAQLVVLEGRVREELV